MAEQPITIIVQTELDVLSSKYIKLPSKAISEKFTIHIVEKEH